MQLEETEKPATEDRATEALEWAVKVALEDVALLEHPPVRPSPEELRAVPLPVLRAHIDEVLVSKNAEPGLDALYAMGVFDAWLPEVAAMVGFGDGEWRHKDVWKHTKQVVRQSVPRVEVRWGALLHDIGKPKTREILPNGEVHFHGHAEVGASMFKKRVAKRLGFEGDVYDRVHFLILYHLRASQYDGSWTDSAVRRFAREMGDGLRDLLDLSRADITTKRPARKKRGLSQISELAGRIRDLDAEDAKVPPLPKGLGTALMDGLGIPPSRKLGDLMKILEAKCEAGELEGQRDFAYYVAYVEAHRAELDV